MVLALHISKVMMTGIGAVHLFACIFSSLLCLGHVRYAKSLEHESCADTRATPAVDTIEWKEFVSNIESYRQRRAPFVVAGVPIPPFCELQANLLQHFSTARRIDVKASDSPVFTYYDVKRLWHDVYNLSDAHIHSPFHKGMFNVLHVENCTQSFSKEYEYEDKSGDKHPFYYYSKRFPTQNSPHSMGRILQVISSKSMTS